MKSYSAREAAKKFGVVLDDIEKGPVTIMKHGRPRAVILTAWLFEKYRKDHDKASEEHLVDLLHTSLDLLKEGKLGKGQKALALARRLRVHEERGTDAREAERTLAERAGEE